MPFAGEQPLDSTRTAVRWRCAGAARCRAAGNSAGAPTSPAAAASNRTAATIQCSENSSPTRATSVTLLCADLHQAVEDVRGAIGGFLLGAVQRVVVLRVLVVGQVGLDGLGIDDREHVIGDGLALHFADQRGERTRPGRSPA